MNDIAASAGVLPGSLYHHFASKEEIAIELVSDFNDDLGALSALVRSALHDGTPERRLRDMAARSAELSMRHAAAVRLSGYQPPTTTTERLAAVLDLDAGSQLVAIWRTIVEATVASAEPPVDAALLRFTIANLTLGAGTAYLPGTDMRPVADQVCDLLLYGLSRTTPSDAELDASGPMQTAIDLVTGWTAESPAEVDDRRVILSAARKEFARRGYDATTIRGIADTAQIGMGTIYRRVSSKEALLTELLTTYSQVLTEGVEQVTASEGSEVEKLDAVAYVLVHALLRFPEETEIVKFGWNGQEPGSRPFQEYREQTYKRLGMLEALVARGLAAGAFRAIGTPAELAVLIRRVIWLRYHDFEGSSPERTHAFLRRSMLRPTLI